MPGSSVWGESHRLCSGDAGSSTADPRRNQKGWCSVKTTCSKCSSEFTESAAYLAKRGKVCRSCRNAHQRKWCKTRGIKSGSKTWDPAKQAAWKARYYSDSKVREVRAARERTRRRSLEHRERIAARQALWNAIRRGELDRKPCKDCGAQKTDAHHDDYARPLSVRWLCRKCHVATHAKAGGAK